MGDVIIRDMNGLKTFPCGTPYCTSTSVAVLVVCSSSPGADVDEGHPFSPAVEGNGVTNEVERLHEIRRNNC